MDLPALARSLDGRFAEGSALTSPWLLPGRGARAAAPLPAAGKHWTNASNVPGWAQKPKRPPKRSHGRMQAARRRRVPKVGWHRARDDFPAPDLPYRPIPYRIGPFDNTSQSPPLRTLSDQASPLDATTSSATLRASDECAHQLDERIEQTPLLVMFIRG